MQGLDILVTGGTGSFGRMFTAMTLRHLSPTRLTIFSRDEMKQWEMAKTYAGDSRVRFVGGDVRDRERLKYAVRGVNVVVHAAASKIVPTAEKDPCECVKTNVLGAMNLIDACRELGVTQVVAVSTDKASAPINLYGGTKFVAERLFVAANTYSRSGTAFAVVRCGNLMGSRGSLIPVFLSIAGGQKIPVTDLRMTRFMLTLEGATELVWYALGDMVGGEVYVRKSPSMRVVDVAAAVRPGTEIEVIGIRPGEKLHEQLIDVCDAPRTYKYPMYYKILPALHDWSRDPQRVKAGERVADEFSYRSENNSEWMTIEVLRRWIESNRLTIGAF